MLLLVAEVKMSRLKVPKTVEGVVGVAVSYTLPRAFLSLSLEEGEVSHS